MRVEYYSKSAKELKVYHIENSIPDPDVYEEMTELLYPALADEPVLDILKKTLQIAIDITESEVGSIVIEREEFLECICFGEKRCGMTKPGSGNKDKEGLFMRALVDEIVVISNDILDDPRLGSPEKFAKAHPFLTKFMAIPLYSEPAKALLCLSGSKKKYHSKTVQRILPLAKITGILVSKQEAIVDAIPPEKAKERFLATMSHELRTPLNGIVGMITLIPGAGKLSPKQQEYMRNLTECTLELSGLIGNILDFSKMEENKLELRQEQLSITEVVQDVVNMVHGSVVDKNIKLDIKMQDIPPLLGDRQRLVQILANLVTNSIKFTDKGYISIGIESEHIENSMDRKIRITVEDTGIGISPLEQLRIFDMFHQAQTSNYVSGTGLGLSIVKKLVEMMGGKIHVSSPGIGHGALFDLFIILKEQQQPITLSDDNKRLLKGKKVLVIDDKQEIRMQLSDILIRYECNIHPASSAEEALGYLRYGYNFDIAIVDICMPNMSGIELAQEIRRLYPTLPLIGLSSTERDCGSEWFDEYLFKPIITSQIVKAMIGILTPFNLGNSISVSPKRKKVSKSRLKILIAEDDKHNIFTIKEFLKTLGYRSKNIKIVRNGLEVVNEVRKRPNVYHVILMDLVMPLMTGEEAAKEIKSLENSPMIIMVSAAVQSCDKNRCQNAGIDGYLAKPIEIDRLRAALVPLLKEKK